MAKLVCPQCYGNGEVPIKPSYIRCAICKGSGIKPPEQGKETQAEPYEFDLQRAIDASNRADEKQYQEWVDAGKPDKCDTCRLSLLTEIKAELEKLGMDDYKEWQSFWQSKGVK